MAIPRHIMCTSTCPSRSVAGNEKTRCHMRHLTYTGSQYSGFFDIPILRRPINKCADLVRRYLVVSESPENRSIRQFHVTSRVRPENYER